MLPSSSLPVATFETMGTVVSLRLADTVAGQRRLGEGLATAERVFERWNERFSLYSPTSEISLVASGHVRLTDASEELRSCYALALDWRDRTGGVFTPHRADGVIDLSGVVKALAIEEAGVALTSIGCESWSINAGGDVLVRGMPSADAQWVTSIVNPVDRHDVLASVPMSGAFPAVATSGSAERGEHIWTPAVELSPFRQVSVFAADIVTADVLATAIVAGGESTLNESTAGHAIEVLAVLRDGQLLATRGLRQPSR